MTRILLTAVTIAALVGAAPPSYADGVQPVPVPPAGRAVDTSDPDHVVGRGTPTSCTSAAVVRAVRRGGVITFDCGPEPVTIRMHRTAKVVNESRRVVIDGGGLVTLDGGGEHRILYQNTCDPRQKWTTSHCNDQATPRLVLQHLRLARGSSVGDEYDGGGGGAVFVRGGRLRIVDSTFVGNRAVGRGVNPARDGTPGGGSGGAIYLDGNRFTLDLGGTLVRDNVAREGGGAVFFVSNDRTGTMRIRHSTLEDNPSQGFETRGLPGIFFLGARRPEITSSTLR